MAGCTGCLKFVIFFFNFLMWLLGCSLLAIGIWLKLDDTAAEHIKEVTEVDNEEYDISFNDIRDVEATMTMAWLYIVFGSIIILITFIGCCGAVRESAILLSIYAMGLICLMLVIIGIGTWAYIKWDKNKDDPELHQKVMTVTDAALHHAIENYLDDRDAQLFMSTIEKKFKCCGYKGVEDYEELGFKKTKDLKTKDDRVIPCTHYTKRCKEPYSDFATDEVRTLIHDRLKVIIWMSFCLAIIMGVGLVFTILLCCVYRRTTTLSVN